MRIISGKYKGRRLHPPKGLPVRPTTDFAKEGLFNYLVNYINFEEASVLDLFSGTGSMAYEFASRGAKQVVCIEKNNKCVRFINQTAESFEIPNFTVHQSDVFGWLKNAKQPFELIFADPPYDLPNIEKIHELVFENQLLTNNGRLIIEHGKQTNLSEKPYFAESRKYSNVNFSVFKNE